MNQDEWKSYARSFVLGFAKRGRVFSGNELWANGLVAPSNRRILSTVLLTLERDGKLVRVGRTESVGGHGQPILLWRLA